MFMRVMGGTGEERGIYIPCMVHFHFLSLHRKLRMAKGRRGREGRGGKEREGEGRGIYKQVHLSLHGHGLRGGRRMGEG